MWSKTEPLIIQCVELLEHLIKIRIRVHNASRWNSNWKYLKWIKTRAWELYVMLNAIFSDTFSTQIDFGPAIFMAYSTRLLLLGDFDTFGDLVVWLRLLLALGDLDTLGDLVAFWRFLLALGDLDALGDSDALGNLVVFSRFLLALGASDALGDLVVLWLSLGGLDALVDSDALALLWPSLGGWDTLGDSDAFGELVVLWRFLRALASLSTTRLRKSEAVVWVVAIAKSATERQRALIFMLILCCFLSKLSNCECYDWQIPWERESPVRCYFKYLLIHSWENLNHQIQFKMIGNLKSWKGTKQNKYYQAIWI